MPSNAVAIIHRDQIIEQIAKGKRLSDIAPTLGLSSPNSISKVLKKDPEYRSAIESGFHCRLDEAEKDLESATEQVDVARARARFQSVAWRAEREFPETWGAKQQITVNQGVTLDQALDGVADQLLARMRIVDGEVETVAAQQQNAPQSELSTDSMHSPSDTDQ